MGAGASNSAGLSNQILSYLRQEFDRVSGSPNAEKMVDKMVSRFPLPFY